MVEKLQKLLEPIKTRLKMMIVRSLITSTTGEDGEIRLEVNMLAGETRDDIENIQQYGVSSRPKPGAQSLIICIGGSRDHSVSIATKGMSENMVIELKEDEVALHTDEGDKIHLKNGNIIELKTKIFNITATDSVNIDTPQITSTGEISDSVGNLSSLRNNFNKHTHIGNLGAPTSPPDSPDSGGS